MPTDLPRRAGEGGFTMLEVLFAMIILAVGLLALQGLGVMAVKTLGVADRKSRSAAVAAEYLEDGLRLIRANQLPSSFACPVGAYGDNVQRTVDNTTNPNLPSVTVTVTPAAGSGTPLPFSMTASTFVSTPVSAVSSSTPCAS